MTVCIGVLCQEHEGVILVADRMVTSGLAIEFEHPSKNKMTQLSENCVALTSGNALVYTELFSSVRQETANLRVTSVESLVEAIKESYQALRRKKIVERVLMPRGFSGFKEFYQAMGAGLSESAIYPVLSEIDRFGYGLDILVGGISPNGAHLYCIDDPGTSQCFDSIGFHAIGSGTNLALSSLIASGCNQDMPCVEAIIVALTAKMTAENAPGVGRKTDISLILPHPDNPLGAPVRFNPEEIDRLRKLCQLHGDGEAEACHREISELISSKIAAIDSTPNRTETDNDPIGSSRKDQGNEVDQARDNENACNSNDEPDAGSNDGVQG